MASFDTLLPQSNTMLVTTSATPSTPTTQALVFPGAGASAMSSSQNPVPPPVALIQNLGTAVVWVSLTLAARTAAIPAAGNTTIEIPILPGQTVTYRHPWAQGSSGAEGSPGGPTTQGPPGSTTINLNMISATASQSLAITFGEGL